MFFIIKKKRNTVNFNLHGKSKAVVGRGALLGVSCVCIDPRCTCSSRVGLSYSHRNRREPDFFCTFVGVASSPRDTRTPL